MPISPPSSPSSSQQTFELRRKVSQSLPSKSLFTANSTRTSRSGRKSSPHRPPSPHSAQHPQPPSPTIPNPSPPLPPACPSPSLSNPARTRPPSTTPTAKAKKVRPRALPYPPPHPAEADLILFLAEREFADFGGNVPDERVLVRRMTRRNTMGRMRSASASGGSSAFPGASALWLRWRDGELTRTFADLHLVDSAFSEAHRARSRAYSQVRDEGAFFSGERWESRS